MEPEPNQVVILEGNSVEKWRNSQPLKCLRLGTLRLQVHTKGREQIKHEKSCLLKDGWE